MRYGTERRFQAAEALTMFLRSVLTTIPAQRFAVFCCLLNTPCASVKKLR